MGRSTGLEPATLGTTNRCSNQLSYDRHDPGEDSIWVLAGRGSPLREPRNSCKRSKCVMAIDNPHATLKKFGYPGTLLHQGEHWAVLVRPAQPTLGSLVLCALSEEKAYGDLTPEAFAEQGALVKRIERLLRNFSAAEKINYLMLMMVDPHVHYHVIPRYADEREFDGQTFPDSGWPGLPELGRNVPASETLIEILRKQWGRDAEIAH